MHKQRYRITKSDHDELQERSATPLRPEIKPEIKIVTANQAAPASVAPTPHHQPCHDGQGREHDAIAERFTAAAVGYIESYKNRVIEHS